MVAYNYACTYIIIIRSDLQDDVPKENLGRPGRFTLAYMHTWAMRRIVQELTETHSSLHSAMQPIQWLSYCGKISGFKTIYVARQANLSGRK